MTYLWLALKVLIYHAFAIYLYPAQEKGQKDQSHVEIIYETLKFFIDSFQHFIYNKFLANFMKETERAFGVLRLIQMLFL